MARVLLYNIQNEEKEMKIRLAAFRLGIQCQSVAAEDFGAPVGYLLGLTGYARGGECAERFTDEMLLMEDLRGGQLNAFLDALRTARVPVALKAVVTEHNVGWSSLRLHEELKKEHAAMQTAARRSVHKKRK
ncbi:MAG: DUF3783 domain-containing protein [Oscillospiraceae bacterium]|nr:DUF3783 domain-containing protein [Oscillospiraceae bacterium]